MVSGAILVGWCGDRLEALRAPDELFDSERAAKKRLSVAHTPTEGLVDLCAYRRLNTSL